MSKLEQISRSWDVILTFFQLDRLYLDKPPSGVASKSAENSLALVRYETVSVYHVYKQLGI